MSQVLVRSIESWRKENVVFAISLKQSYTAHIMGFFSAWLLNQLLSCTYLVNPLLLCYIICSFTLPVIILKMVDSTSQAICAIPSSCCFIFRLLLGLIPKPVLRKVTRVSHIPMFPYCGLPTPLPSSLCLQPLLSWLRKLLWGWKAAGSGKGSAG